MNLGQRLESIRLTAVSIWVDKFWISSGVQYENFFSLRMWHHFLPQWKASFLGPSEAPCLSSVYCKFTLDVIFACSRPEQMFVALCIFGFNSRKTQFSLVHLNLHQLWTCLKSFPSHECQVQATNEYLGKSALVRKNDQLLITWPAQQMCFEVNVVILYKDQGHYWWFTDSNVVRKNFISYAKPLKWSYIL